MTAAYPAARPRGAQTPEELETLLEDALLLGDVAAARALFDDRGVLVVDGKAHRVHHHRGVPGALGGYLAEPRVVVRAGDTALLVGDGVVNVAHRDVDGDWHYRIVVVRSAVA